MSQSIILTKQEVNLLLVILDHKLADLRSIPGAEPAFEATQKLIVRFEKYLEILKDDGVSEVEAEK